MTDLARHKIERHVALGGRHYRKLKPEYGGGWWYVTRHRKDAPLPKAMWPLFDAIVPLLRAEADACRWRRLAEQAAAQELLGGAAVGADVYTADAAVWLTDYEAVAASITAAETSVTPPGA